MGLRSCVHAYLIITIVAIGCGGNASKGRDDAAIPDDGNLTPDSSIDAGSGTDASDGGPDSSIDAPPLPIDAAIDAPPPPIDAAIDAPPPPIDAPIDAPPPPIDAPPPPIDAPPSPIDAAVDAGVPVDALVCNAGQTNCNGTCTNTQTDPDNCNTCGNSCGAGSSCSFGLCCANGQTNCNGVCVDTSNDDNHCSACNTPCGAGEVCSSSQCLPNCLAGQTLCNGTCINTSNDPSNCGGCGITCSSGTVCSNSACVCPPDAPDTCGGQCVDTADDPNHCGDCTTACASGELCSLGTCCGQGETSCGGTCSDLTDDDNNCGFCGNQCGAGSTCTNGQCECGFNQVLCNGQCITPSIDPTNCGSCGNTCGTGEFCVSNGCTTSCPTPLQACGNECTNIGDDNANCGGCGIACGAGLGCSDGICVPPVSVGPPPAKCLGGGPPIDVPLGGAETCTGAIAGVTFTFALCSCTDVGPLSRTLTTDGFDSTQGPYVPGDIGASVGVNDTIDDTAKMTIGGDLWVAGPDGMTTKGEIEIAQRLFNGHRLDFSKLLSVDETAFIGGPIVQSGGGLANIVDTLTTPSCGAVPGAMTFGSCVSAPVVVPEPCACDANEKIPVRAIVQHFANPANNDNAAIGLSPAVFSNPTGRQRLDLECGVYYLDAINASQPITIVVHGRTALVIGGSITNSQELILDLDPTATLDIFVGGAMKGSQDLTIGSPAFPRLTRMFIGSNGCRGNGGSGCTTAADCCSGVCNANGTCEGGGGALAESLQISGNAFLNGLFYAGHGTVKISNPLEMYGAVFANFYEASSPTLIHFDRAAVEAAEECFEAPPTSCTDCTDCQNQACSVFGQCGSCSVDSDCCPPLRCKANGVCEL
jgi:hypothetical protein